ncbi:uncharacterized protein CTRU02_206888 [Colletotrichum truncatum]|uniref:Uncharacterized protein n=1 Tax=Colletotrichum truncatum TaxID=5467 RepID=A0ACC3YZT1_COLTU|nr:uncharacterized protein CTRU02_15383 [Colletotrichum truncatum]KAF6781103.1 hypothetical protein CTRU02_15383 [Colletotrichum truncatum]
MSTTRTPTFRVQGIPCEYQTRSDVRVLIKNVLSLGPSASVVVHSIPICPVERNSRTATVSFGALPECLSDYSKNQWVFRPGAEDDLSIKKSLVFDTHFSGFTPLQETFDKHYEIDVIAVSGLGGHAFGSFKERQGSFMWLRDALPLDVPNARILIWGYNTHLAESSSFQNLSDLGILLKTDLKGIRDSSQPRSIIFIGHSLGGIVIKEAIIRLKGETGEACSQILDSITGFVFFGVPHQGLAIESLVPLVKNQPNRSLLESLTKNSALLQRLDKEFHSAIAAKSPTIVAYYETETSPTAVEVTTGKWELVGPKQVLVDVSSAKTGSQQHYPINRSHSEMVKYSSEYDEIYKRVRTILQELLEKPQGTSTARDPEAGPKLSLQLSDDSKDCLRSLSFREQEHRYDDIYSAKDTCNWILEDHQYQAWTNGTRGLFWIKGNPGAGKSVLMKFAATRMRQKTSSELVVSFCIHGRGSPLQKTPLGVFRALLNSMLQSFPQYLAQLTETFRDRELRYGSWQEKRWEWTEKELENFMSEVLTKGTKNQPVVIFVDALDEMGEHHAKVLLAYFKTLLGEFEREKAQVKICFSSRHYPIIGDVTVPVIYVEERNDKDIRLVVRERLKEIRAVTKRQQLENEILMKAHGGFQWVTLIVTDILAGNASGKKTETLLKKLRATPEALDELYADILCSVDGSMRYQMTKLFRWVLFAQRPLSTHELREALAVDKDTDCTTITQLRCHDSWIDTSADFEKHVIDLSGGLVEFRTRELWEQYEASGEDWDREAQFVHQSAADYVLEKFIKSVGCGPESPIGAGHFEVSRSCLRYLTLSEILQSTDLSQRKLSATFPLLPYTVRSLFYHAKEVERAGIPQLDLCTLIQWGGQSEVLNEIAKLWRIMDPDNAHAPRGWPFIGATPLHVSIGFGLLSSFIPLLRDGIDFDVKDTEGNTPLLLALRESHEDMALLLLDRSIELQGQDAADDLDIIRTEGHGQRRDYLAHINAKNVDDETPLNVALTVKAGKAIFKLIGLGADLDLFGRQIELVFYAIHHRDRKVLKMLIQKHVKLDGAVFFAVKEVAQNEDHDGLEIVAELLEAGCNTSKCLDFHQERQDEDGDDNEAMAVASRKGGVAVVSLLLSHSVPADSRDELGRTPLLIAVENGHNETVKLLLSTGKVNADVEDDDGRKPLLLAVQHGYEAVVQQLLETERVDVNSKDYYGQTPLLLAVQHGYKAVVQQLLETERVDVNSKDYYSQTPLLLAAQNGYEAVIRLLLKTERVDINSADQDGRTPLLLAAQNGYEAVVRLLLETERIDVNSADQDGRTPLLLAAQNGYEAVVRLLLETERVDINSTDQDGRTPLLLAAQNGYEAVVRLLLKTERVDTNSKDHYGRTPLLLAVQHGYKAVVQQLLETERVDVNSKDYYGQTPLLLAAQNGYEAVVRLLLKTERVDTNSKDHYGRTLLLLAVQQGYEAVVQQLLETERVDVNSADQDGRTPLLLAIQHGHEVVVQLLLNVGKVNADSEDHDRRTVLSWAIQYGYEAVVRLLLNTDNVNSEDNNGRTLLSWAAQYGREAIVKLLLDIDKLDIDLKDQYGRAPLLWAAQYGHESVVKLLLNTDNADSEDNNGRTLLSWAVQYSREAVIKLLLNTGKVDVNSEDKDGRTPLSWAVQYGDEVTVRLLLDTDKVDIDLKDQYGRAPLLWAAQHGSEAVMKLLLNTDNADSEDNNGRTLLSWAAQYGRAAIIELLLNTDNADSEDNNGRTLLSWAAQHGHKAVIRLLLNTGKVDVNSKDKNKQTPLSWAAQHGREAVIMLLLDTGKVDVNSEDYTGRTPLSWAAQSGCEVVIKLLLDTGKVDVNSEDYTGRTPLSWAVQSGREAVIKLLLDTGKVDVNSKDQFGLNPLAWASFKGHKAAVNLLLNAENIDVDAKDQYGLTPLAWAAHQGHYFIVKLLLDTEKVNINGKDHYGRTPLSRASHQGHKAVVEQLCNTAQVDIDAQDQYGLTPLARAAYRGHVAIVKQLLDTGTVKIESKDQFGRTPLFWAIQEGHTKVVELLLHGGISLDVVIE